MQLPWINLIPQIGSGSSQRDVLKIVLSWIHKVLTVFGFPIVVIAFIEALHLNNISDAIFYVILYAPIFIGFMLRKVLPYKVRSIILFFCMYLLAVMNIYSYGFSGAGIPLFFTLFILASLYFNIRGGLIAIGVSIVPTAVIGWLMVHGVFSVSVDLMKISVMPVSWVTAGMVLVFLGCIMVISVGVIKINLMEALKEKHQRQTSLEEVNKQLSDLLEEKNVLLQEVHHRVRNNLNIVISLLHLKQSQIKNREDAIQAFQESEQQIYSIALVHERLYEYKSSSKIDMQDYIKTLCCELEIGFGRERGIKCISSAESVMLNVRQAIPCGLIINELVTNAYKHAFTSDETGTIEVGLEKNQNTDTITLSVTDNGVGFDSDSSIGDVESIGLNIVALQVKQLNGDMHIKRENGTTVTITFPV
ncbi:MAG: sensor histidine kinase [Spirochaetia bacterium]